MNTPDLSVSSHPIAILGGSFDPIHFGHIKPVIYAAKLLDIQQVLLMPAYVSPHKKNTVANTRQRLAMIELVCREYPLFKAEPRELLKEHRSYTLDTLQEISQEDPQQQCYFFIGMDSLLNFTKWYKYQEILRFCQLIVYTRPNYNLKNINNETKSLLRQYKLKDSKQLEQQQCGGILLISCPEDIEQDISSSHIRAKLKQQQNCQHLMPTSIIKYICDHQLYS
ncbi:MAG: nicotinate-nucleotide adenylyltransferase [Gammaproteobacteria bacterium]|nr:MAG: nicotinate-nucleotide adenylyltransferase [Gammaproteobacteria bacterium]